MLCFYQCSTLSSTLLLLLLSSLLLQSITPLPTFWPRHPSGTTTPADPHRTLCTHTPMYVHTHISRYLVTQYSVWCTHTRSVLPSCRVDTSPLCAFAYPFFSGQLAMNWSRKGFSDVLTPNSPPVFLCMLHRFSWKEEFTLRIQYYWRVPWCQWYILRKYRLGSQHAWMRPVCALFFSAIVLRIEVFQRARWNYGYCRCCIGIRK